VCCAQQALQLLHQSLLLLQELCLLQGVRLKGFCEVLNLLRLQVCFEHRLNPTILRRCFMLQRLQVDAAGQIHRAAQCAGLLADTASIVATKPAWSNAQTSAVDTGNHNGHMLLDAVPAAHAHFLVGSIGMSYATLKIDH
jgi:hypothetical protein